jgi:hypothetical protein
VERSEPAYRDVAARAGHTLEFHSGHTGGRGSPALVGLARAADLLIVVTDVNSHNAVQLARREARKFGVRVALFRRLSPARFGAFVAELDAPLRQAG